MSPTSRDLDTVLALQMLVAWAGEAECEPRRLGWWRTDLIDPDGGGYLLETLLPRTHRWAGLQAVRMAAIRTDREAREPIADPEQVISLFHWGFRIDEKLDERIRELKAGSAPPFEILGRAVPPADGFDRDALAAKLETFDPVEVEIEPWGRRLLQVPDDLATRARSLARALVPFTDRYPLPYFLAPNV